MSPETLRFGPYSFEIFNTEKVFFPEAGLTKGDLIDYYRHIADTMVPYMIGRPVTMERYPDGIQEEGFFQKEISEHFPDWIERVTVEKEGGVVTHVICRNAATLTYLANQGCITPHVWLSRSVRPRHPDRIIFDLDPPDDDFGPVRAAAQAIAELMRELQLRPFVMTTGSRGLHVLAPLDRSADFEAARRLAREVAALIASRDPQRFTTETRVKKRRGRLLLDVMRNAYAQTAVTPYAVRARPGAPVATPLDWSELSDPALTPRSYGIANVFRRLGQKQDPWRGMTRHARSLKEPRRRLDALLSDVGLDPDA